MLTLEALRTTLPQRGEVRWVGVRPARGEPMAVVESVEARPGRGLTGDRFAARRTVREVTLLQYEHLAAIAGLLHRATIDPALLRRNILVAGINLLALRDQRFRVGAALFEGTGLAHPCSRMETALGPGGYNAMRGHGGITARIHTGGILRLGDPVALAIDSPADAAAS